MKTDYGQGVFMSYSYITLMRIDFGNRDFNKVCCLTCVLGKRNNNTDQTQVK